MDRMRESLFSILGPLDGMSFLDLFSGSGCVAIEAASRGASPIHLVEGDRGKKETIEGNLSFVQEDRHLFIMDVGYADPPFRMEGKIDLARKVSDYGLLEDGGLFIIHFPEEEDRSWPETVGELHLSDRRKYGRSILRFYRKEDKS